MMTGREVVTDVDPLPTPNYAWKVVAAVVGDDSGTRETTSGGAGIRCRSLQLRHFSIELIHRR